MLDFIASSLELQPNKITDDEDKNKSQIEFWSSAYVRLPALQQYVLAGVKTSFCCLFERIYDVLKLI